MAGNFFYVKLVVSADSSLLKKFEAYHLLDGGFDLNSILQLPQELDLEFNNMVEAGYDALYGDWKKPAKFWMLKEAAAAFYFPFPLEGRDQVVRCLKTLDCAESYLGPGQRYKENLEKFGHGSRETWQKENWGTDDNACGVKVFKGDDQALIWFVSNNYPAKAVKRLSRLYPEGIFTVWYVDDFKRTGMNASLKNGREFDKRKLAREEKSTLILEYEQLGRAPDAE